MFFLCVCWTVDTFVDLSLSGHVRHDFIEKVLLSLESKSHLPCSTITFIVMLRCSVCVMPKWFHQYNIKSYHIISDIISLNQMIYSYHIIFSYHIVYPYHIIYSYHIISYRIVSYHIISISYHIKIISYLIRSDRIISSMDSGCLTS